MNILGISCFYHDSAACLVHDGEIIAAVQEELFTRKKHDDSFPIHAIRFCLEKGQISSQDIDFIVFYDKPILKFERLTETFLMYAPSGIRQFMQAMPIWLKYKLWIADLIGDQLGYNKQLLFIRHHQAHAASAFYPSPFQEAAIVTFDGVGEWETTSFGVGKDNEIRLRASLRYPHSLGLLYSAFTYYVGFKVNSGEYKLMGLAPYGEPVFERQIRENLIDLKEDGSFRLNMKYFGYCNSLKMINRRFEQLFGEGPRQPESKITQKHMDIAASIQKVTEDVMLRIVKQAYAVTGQKNLCLAGGVALNCVGNGRILREGPFDNLWVQPAASDAGGALGAALFVWYSYLDNERSADGEHDCQKSSFLGPEFDDVYIERFLSEKGVSYKRVPYADIPSCISDLIMNGNVIGWFQGRAEFGPRALGARSIIADPRNPQMQSKLNLKIKFRESFRPFAPTVLRECVSEWFDLDIESPYMLLVAPVSASKRLDFLGSDNPPKGFQKLKQLRSLIPAVTHVDYSARIQTIKRQDHQLYYDTLKAFYEKTGCPVIVNTSFNVRGEPLVCSPEEAYRCFMRTEMDYLIMGSFLLSKSEQKPFLEHKDWRKEFQVD